ncbi:MAG: putative LPS assembly protein LptD [Candidatus Neomarinimicrobiota bacterium]
MIFLSYKKTLKFALFFSLTSIIFASERLFLKKANILENKTLLEEQVKFISGDVILTKGDLTLYCQDGQQYANKDIAVLYNDILVTQHKRNLTCDTIKFYSKNDILLSIGNSHVWDNEYDLKADSITVFTKIDSGVAVGNVTLIQRGQTIKANRIEYQKYKKQDGISYSALGDVSIADSSRIAICGMARYNRKNETTILEINPKIKENNRILSGDKIILEYENKILEKLEIPKNAFAVTPIRGFKESLIDSIPQNDSIKFEDQMEGSKLYTFFKNGNIDSIRIEGMAKSLYHVFEDSIYQGKNDASGDTIAISFLNNELDMINIIGGSEGKYTPDSSSNEINEPVNYKANKIKYHINDYKSDLQGNVILKHDHTNLEAGFVNINWKTNMLDALPILEGDTLSDPIFPVINEQGRDPMTGNEMIYNLKTRKGRITQGKTKADDGYYKGNRIRNESRKVFFIENSIYTTCDQDTAHFHFESNKMKVIQNNMVVARPIILHLGQIPILGIPLGIFPHKGGKRHSGWIMPSYGDNKNRGQYIQGLGFYWAPSEYWDSKFTLGFGDKQGATFKINTQYRVRYKYNGSLNFFNRQYLNGTNDIMDLTDNRNASTTLRWAHKQELRNNQALNANVTYSTSGDYNKKYGLSEAERMDQKAISNINYSKRWPKSKNSFSTNFYSNIDLLIDEKTNPQSNYFIAPNRSGIQLNIQNRTFPKFSFRHGQSNLFPSTATKKKWYNTITWNYGLNYTNTNRKYYESVETDSALFEWEKDSIGLLIQQNEENNGWIHTSSINAPQKLFKYISINPSANFKSAWVNETQEGNWNGSKFNKTIKKGFASRTTGSFSMNTNTQLYGLFSIPIGPLKAIRHVLSPSIGYSWTPDFSKRFFGQDLGYVITKKDSLNNEIYHDRFSGTMAGNTPRSERKSMTFGLNNILQAKIKKGEEDEKKIDLLSWRMSSSYNFAADSIKLANLRSSVRSKIAGKLNLDLSMTHDFYKYDLEKNRRTGEFNRDKSGILSPRLVNARLSTGFKILGSSWSDDEKEDHTQTNKDSIDIEEDLSGPSLIDPLKNMKNKNSRNQTWSTNVSLSYSYIATNPSHPRKTFWANTTTTINVTPNWRVSYRARFDMIKRDLVSHSFSIYRDLHCWELSLNWTPNGLGQGINFRLNVKSPTLSDLKIEKKGGVYSGAGL